jgi:hypothetical protein
VAVGGGNGGVFVVPKRHVGGRSCRGIRSRSGFSWVCCCFSCGVQTRVSACVHSTCDV